MNIGNQFNRQTATGFETIAAWRGWMVVFVFAVLGIGSRNERSYGLDESNSRRPNVIVILSDDQGWGDLSLHGNRNLSTPNIDRLAAEGAAFERFFVCPVCSPTRAEFLTGRYHPRMHVYSTSAGGERMDLGEVTIADTFKAAGYVTGAFGKWHNGMQHPYHPNGRGFDEYYGFCSGHWGNYFDPMLEHNGKLVRGCGFCVDDFTNRLLEFVGKNRDRPFFAYLPLNTPHSPMQVPDRFWNRFRDKELKMRHREPGKEKIDHTRAALAMCENIDWNVGRILKRLDELDLADNTIVVYFCDNGPNGSRWNGGMKGRKGSTDEGGVRSPLLIRMPGRISAGQEVKQIGAAIDLLPTLAELCGINLISRKKLDGMSLVPVLTKQTDKGLNNALRNRLIVSHWRERVSVRSQRFRLDHRGQLFDMEADPGQYHNVAGNHPKVLKRLAAAAEDFRRQVLPGYNDDQRPFIIGHPDAKYTQVPARDGTAHGNIMRSNKFPNCSFFTNWKDVNDRVTWQVTVPQSGEFEVFLYYTCPKDDIGSQIQLSFGKQKIRKTITVAHDPPLKGAEHDRVKRTESYVKDFQPMSLGKIRLEKGSGELELRALKIPGRQAMDFRLLQFVRQ